MSAATFAPGTPSTSLAHRMMLAFRLTLASRLASDGPVGLSVPLQKPAQAGLVDIPRSAADPLDDLLNATWEDAEWQ